MNRGEVIDRLVAGESAPAGADASASSRLQLVLVGERLIGTQGIDAVSLRQVAAEAGNANTSAVQYHFGSKEGLVQAIFEHRVPRLNQRRRVLLTVAASGGRPLDLRAALEAWLLPLVEEAEDPQSLYMSFLAQLSQFGRGQHAFDRSPPELQRPSRDFMALVGSYLDAPEPIRSNRIAFAANTCIHVAADRERSRLHDPDAAVLPYSLFVADLFDALLGGLQAPVSANAQEALKAVGDFDPHLLLP